MLHCRVALLVMLFCEFYYRIGRYITEVTSSTICLASKSDAQNNIHNVKSIIFMRLHYILERDFCNVNSVACSTLARISAPSATRKIAGASSTKCGISLFGKYSCKKFKLEGTTDLQVYKIDKIPYT